MNEFEQLFVTFIDDTNKPDDIGDWPEKGKIYKVVDVMRNSTMDGSFGFVLEGLNPQGKYDTYRHTRFAEFARLNLN